MGRDAGRDRAALELAAALRLLGAQATIFHVALAERFGLGGSDLRCLAFLRENAPVTAGRLAEITGLTTGAVTGMIDRLERAGFARRTEDPNDRRRVLVEPTKGKDSALDQEFAPLMRATRDCFEKYSEKELRAFAAFIRDALPAFREVTKSVSGAHGEQPRVERAAKAASSSRPRRVARGR
jgi:DNA-binding MarR family transcriptional regulator